MAATKTETRPKPKHERELDAMKKTGRLLLDLPDQEAQARVVAWAVSNFGRTE